MAIYTVKPGDCMSSIAAAFGLGDYKDIYDAPANAEYRKLRPNPDIIQPGDKIVIPDLIPFTRVLATGQKHTIKVKLPRATLQVYLKDADGEPVAGKDYLLHVDGQKDKKGTTTGEGLVKEDVPATATSANIAFPEQGFSFDVKLGKVDPIGSRTGLASRLRNLGYPCAEGSTPKETAENLCYALARFQTDHGLDPTGDADQDTVDLLMQEHDRGKES
jgi:hypothetical protein